MPTKASTPSSRSAAPCGAGDKQWRTDNRVRRNGRAAKGFEDTHEESSSYRRGSVWWPAPSPARAVPGRLREPQWSRAAEGAGHHTEPAPDARSGRYLAESALVAGGVGG